MAIESLLKFRNLDSSENINARLSGLLPKGILKGGVVVAEPSSLQVRIKGVLGEPWVFLAIAADGMLLREKAEEKVLPVIAGVVNVIALRAKYVESGPPLASLEVMTLGAYLSDPNQDTIIRLASVSPPNGAIAVSPEDIDLSFRDSIEGFTRRVIRDVVDTKEDLPAVSGFPATAEINFLANDFVPGSAITISTGLTSEVFSIVPPISFKLAPPSTPGLSRINPSQVAIASAIEASLTGIVTVTTASPHNLFAGSQIRITGTNVPACNGVWVVNASALSPFLPADVNTATDEIEIIAHGYVDDDAVVFGTSGTLPGGLNLGVLYIVNATLDTFQVSSTVSGAPLDLTSQGTGTHSISPAGQTNVFTFTKSGSATPFSATGGNLVNTSTISTVIAKTAAGVIHDLVVSQPIIIQGATDPSFNVNSTVASIIDAQTFTFTMSGFPTADSGNGQITKVGFSIPVNGVPIGESTTVTANNFETVFDISSLGPLINATAIGSSLQLEVIQAGDQGNSYSLSKVEPGIVLGEDRIVLSASNFQGGVDPVATTTNVDLRAGDIYVVLNGDVGTMELWGFDGIRFRNLTSSSTASLLDFHRRNLLENEKHLTENEKAALEGTVGTPSAINKYVTEQDTSVLTSNLAAALQGADNVPPDGTNRFLTEARYRGERSEITVPIYTVTGTTTSGSPLITVVVPMTNVTIGQLVVGSGIPANSFIIGIGSGAFTISNNATASASGVVINLKQNFVKLPSNERWVVGNAVDSAIQFFNVVFTDTLKDPGGPTEYTQVNFAPVIIDEFYHTEPPFISGNNVLDPADGLIGADALGIYPRPDAPVLGNPVDLYVKLSHIPDNGDCTVLYSRAAKERIRTTPSDMYTGPQRIIPAALKDIENKVNELRFNSGIGVNSTIISFPENLFVSSNLQTFTFKRSAGGKISELTLPFDINFSDGTGTGGIVNSFTPATFPAANTWTKYLLTLTSTGNVNVYKLEDYLELAGDLAYNISLSSLADANLAFTKGEWLFASVAVQSNSGNTDIENLLPSSVELYPFQSTNSRDAGAEIIVGDGTSSFGHFTGTDAHIRALKTAQPGNTIKLLSGVYSGQWLINKDRISIDFENGAALQHQIPMESLVLAPADFNFSTDVITSASHELLNGHQVKLTSTGTIPSGLSASINYYVVNSTTNTFQLSLTAGGVAVDFSDQGTGVHTIETVLVALNINALRTRVLHPRFEDCDVAVNLTQNATDVEIVNPVFEATVVKNYTSATTLTKPSLSQSNVNTWVCSDGTVGDVFGNFNSANALNAALAAASPGDLVLVYPGTYNRITNWTKNNIHVKGIGSGEVFVDGGGTFPAITVTGSGNIFENMVCTNASIGIECDAAATNNTFSSTVTFTGSVIVNVVFPVTAGTKHFNYHPLVSGNVSVSAPSTGKSLGFVTVGDGVSSWGDYVGLDGINQALLFEQQGTRIRVGKGNYAPITGLTINNMTVEGSGTNCIIQAQAGIHDHCLNVVGSYNKFRGLHLEAIGNDTEDFVILGVDVNGSFNLFEEITFTELGANRILQNRMYRVFSGVRNIFTPHTGAPTGIVSWTVGDGKRSFGDFIGTGGIGSALNTLPLTPPVVSGVPSGAFTAPAANQVVFTDGTLPAVVEFINTTNPYYVDTLYRYITITGATNPVNNGSWKVVQVLGATSVLLERYDGDSFIAEADLGWNISAGAKIWVLPGTYDDFIVQNTQHDVDIEAWSGDVVITGGTPLITVNGHRNRIAGFRLEDNGVGIQVNGRDNIFENNRFSNTLTARYNFASDATDNKAYDAPESFERSCYTVSSVPSRADFSGTDQVAIQAALNAAGADPHIKSVFIGAGTYILTGTITVPQHVTVFGSGYATHLEGDGSFAAFTLNAGGGQTITGIRFDNFTNSLVGPTSDVFAHSNWLVAAPINVNVVGSTGDNL